MGGLENIKTDRNMSRIVNLNKFGALIYSAENHFLKNIKKAILSVIVCTMFIFLALLDAVSL